MILYILRRFSFEDIYPIYMIQQNQVFYNLRTLRAESLYTAGSQGTADGYASLGFKTIVHEACPDNSFDLSSACRVRATAYYTIPGTGGVLT